MLLKEAEGTQLILDWIQNITSCRCHLQEDDLDKTEVMSHWLIFLSKILIHKLQLTQTKPTDYSDPLF